MTKPSQRRPVRYDQSGCMWGLIRILDFRHGNKSTRKLLADKRRASRQTFGAEDFGSKTELSADFEENLPGNLVDEESSKLTAADAPVNKPSVKALIEEEMVCEHHAGIKTSDPKLPPEHHEDRKKSGNRSKRNSRGSLDMEVSNLNCGHESFTSSKCPCNHSPDKASFDKQHGNDIVLEEFCNHINQRGINEVCLELKPNNSELDVKEKLHEAIKEFISREVVKEKSLLENGRVNFSKEVVDALQIPNLNEESFMKLLRDPTSFSMENAEILNLGKDDQLKDSKELLNSNNDNSKQRKFFRRQSRPQETKVPKKGHKGPNCNTIVILKPGSNASKSCATTEIRPDSLSDSSQAQPAERARAYFSLGDIKRRWKNVMGKEQNPDTVVKRPSSRFKGENPEKSPSKDHFFIEKIGKPRDPRVSNESETISSSKQRMPNIYIEARRHLSEMLISGHEEVGPSFGAKSPKTLARILALSEFNSPIPSPGRNCERSFMTTQMKPSGHKDDQFEKVSENEEQKIVQSNGSCLNWSAKGAETESCDVVTHNADTEEETCPAARDDVTPDANTRNIISSDETWEECSGVCTPSELICLPGAECVELINSPETPNQDLETQIPKEEVVHNNQPPSSSFESPPSSCTAKTAEASEILGDKPGRLSPVSVLEPLFTEDISPAKTASVPAEISIEPLKIRFEDGDNFTPPEQGNIFKNHMESAEEETLLLYVTSVLQACGLNWTELYLKSQLSDQLLEPFLYGEVDFFCNHPQFDQNLVFDCINEVLLEVIDHYFQVCPRVSFTKPMIRPIPSLKDAILEVWERVCWHLLLPMPLPRTLDKIVGKDMAKNENWMDLRPDAESIGFDMGDEILDDLIEEFTDEILSSYASSSAKIKESEVNISL